MELLGFCVLCACVSVCLYVRITVLMCVSFSVSWDSFFPVRFYDYVFVCLYICF